MARRVAFLVLFALILSTGPLGTRRGLADNQPVDLSAFEQRVVNLVNAERAKAGLGSLTVSTPLVLAARKYAAYMAADSFFSHDGPDGSTLVTRAVAAGYGTYSFLAENLAAGQNTPETAMVGWMASPGHRANILSPRVLEIGVGLVVGGPYGYYWVQEFGARVLALQSIATAMSAAWTSSATGHTVSGGWLSAYKMMGGLDNLGEPRSDVISDAAMGGQTVQYFQRGVLEFHPENPAQFTIQRRLLGDILYPGADTPVPEQQAPSGDARYFPVSPDQPSGLGHFVADFTTDGQPIYFKQYFESHGGVAAFGFPKEEPKQRDGRWTQRFQAAVFQYHPENDRDGAVPGTEIPYRNYRVQLALLGDQFIQQYGLVLR